MRFKIGGFPLCRYDAKKNVARAKEGNPDVSKRMLNRETRKRSIAHDVGEGQSLFLGSDGDALNHKFILALG